ncbi:DUF481 domain-containing protein [Aestuariibacter halophilus]|uniref:DUF481 domain-containing protein n=1 Tax=Fluctibacter halophilus TaxID=226011 RepID=A0ABS8G9J6_9ALTE|nr:DUF481 domain-containing protein [Aestuariibacter halophilus]MCC2616485.1 DUF481 domain-containing protein [Aestuariibacter halophilus]
MKKTLIATALLCATSAYAQDETKPFTMDGEFGLIVTTGNTETTSVKGRLAAHQELESWSNDFVAEALYKKDEVALDNGEEDSQTTAQKYFLSGQGNYKLENPDHRLFVFGSYEDDRFSSYDYQSTLAVGWSQKLWGDKTSKFEYSIGPGYSYAKTEEGESVSGMIVRAALDYQWKISDSATFKQLLSTEVGSDNTKSKSETSLSAQINGSLAMKLSLTLDHNTDVADGTENLDTQTAVTLVYTFL